MKSACFELVKGSVLELLAKVCENGPELIEALIVDAGRRVSGSAGERGTHYVYPSKVELHEIEQRALALFREAKCAGIGPCLPDTPTELAADYWESDAVLARVNGVMEEARDGVHAKDAKTPSDVEAAEFEALYLVVSKENEWLRAELERIGGARNPFVLSRTEVELSKLRVGIERALGKNLGVVCADDFSLIQWVEELKSERDALRASYDDFACGIASALGGGVEGGQIPGWQTLLDGVRGAIESRLEFLKQLVSLREAYDALALEVSDREVAAREVAASEVAAREVERSGVGEDDAIRWQSNVDVPQRHVREVLDDILASAEKREADRLEAEATLELPTRGVELLPDAGADWKCEFGPDVFEVILRHGLLGISNKQITEQVLRLFPRSGINVFNVAGLITGWSKALTWLEHQPIEVQDEWFAQAFAINLKRCGYAGIGGREVVRSEVVAS